MSLRDAHKQRPLRVLQVLPGLESGGVEKGTLEVARALVAAGHESLVLSAGGRLVAQLEAEGSQHLELDIGRKRLTTLFKVGKVRRLLQSLNLDVIHLRSRLPAWIVWLAWRKMDPATRPRLVTTVHGNYSVSWYSAIMTRGEKVIAVSETIHRYICENYPQTDKANIVTIPRGIDPEDFPYRYTPPSAWSRDWYALYPSLQANKVLILPGRITRLKGHLDFIDIIAGLRQRGVEVSGVIVGDKDPRRLAYAQEVEEAVRAANLEEHIIFSGYRSDVKDIFAVSDGVCSLSLKPESFGRTVLEALSLGTPVVGYDHGGVGEILAALYPQGRVTLGDTQAAVNAWAAILNNELAPPQAHSQFTRAAMLDATLAVYRQLVEAR